MAALTPRDYGPGEGRPAAPNQNPQRFDFGTGPIIASGPGHVSVFSGATGATIWSVQGMADGDLTGFDLAVTDDVNGDGIPELVVGVPNVVTGYGPAMPPTIAAPGRVELRSGANGRLLRSHTTGAPGISDFLGAAVAGGRDVDGDGVADYAASAIANDRVWIWSGAAGAVLRQFHSPGSLDFFGAALAFLDDVNDDGFAELAVGAPLQDAPGLLDPGRIDVLTMRGAQIYGDLPEVNQILDLTWTPGPSDNASAGLVRSSGAPPAGAGLVLVSLAPASLVAGPVTVLIEPTGALVAPVTFDAQGAIAFSAQLALPALSGLSIFVQTVAIVPALPGNVATSNGLQLLHY